MFQLAKAEQTMNETRMSTRAPCNDWTLVYACDLTKMWWFVFHITPDEETVTLADGAVIDIGLILLPRIHSFGVVYVPEKREIVAFMGSNKDPPPLFVLGIGFAMGFINLREDMLGMLVF